MEKRVFEPLEEAWLNLKLLVRCLIRLFFSGFLSLIFFVSPLLCFGVNTRENHLLYLTQFILGVAVFHNGSLLLTKLSRNRQKLRTANKDLEKAYNELEKAHKEIKMKSYYDPLTKVHSNYFLEDLKPRLEAETRRHEWYLWAIMLDLDKLKAINDTFGHEAGDKALCYFAKKLKEVLRETDYCIRLGGDEFVIIGNDQSGTAAKTLAERITENMKSWSLTINNINLKPTASIGYASVKVKKESRTMLEEIINEADVRMYQHKHANY